MFTLTERLTIGVGLSQSGTIYLGSYVDVADRQAIQIHSVDYIFQGATAGATMSATFGSDADVHVQVLDLNRGGLVFANDRALVSSAKGLYDQTGNQWSIGADLYPDNFGKGSDDGRFVVNDQLYIEATSSAIAAGQALNVTVRVNCSVVTLNQKDFMAIALNSTAADN